MCMFKIDEIWLNLFDISIIDTTLDNDGKYRVYLHKENVILSASVITPDRLAEVINNRKREEIDRLRSPIDPRAARRY
jgi:hypothetical protein